MVFRGYIYRVGPLRPHPEGPCAETAHNQKNLKAITRKTTNHGLPMKKTIKMREMLDNQKGIIKRVLATGDMGRRIREMGLVPETPIQIRGRAPLKDPVAVKIRDYVLTLRNNETDSIFVEVEENPPS